MARSKKIVASLVSLTLALVSLFTLCVPTYAATSSKVSDNVDDYLPIVTYAAPLSGSSRVYAYSDSSLNTKQTGYYIDSYVDIIVITKISSNGKAVYVTYPSGSNGKTRSKWFKTDDILGLNEIYIKQYKSNNKITTYRMSSSSKVKSIGYISVGDKCTVLGTHKINNTTYYVTIYPISKTKVNGVSAKYKMALITTNVSSSTNNTSSATASSWDSKVGTTVASIKNGSNYTSSYGSKNISYNGGYAGQCTWYAYGRFLEVNGIALKTARHAKYWLSENKNDSRVRVVEGAENIVAKSIAVRTSGTYGHVIFIEYVTYNANGTPAYVYFTECNTDGNGTYNAGKDCILQKLSYSNFVSTKKPAGYIIAK